MFNFDRNKKYRSKDEKYIEMMTEFYTNLVIPMPKIKIVGFSLVFIF